VEVFAPYLGFLGAGVIAPTRALAPLILIRAIGSVPTVFVDRELVIHKSLAPQFVRLLSSAGISIAMAAAGYGVWALILGAMVSEAGYAVLIWLSVRKQMPVKLTLAHTRNLLTGSRYLFLIAAISLPLQQGDVLVVGTLLDPRTVGIYTMALTLVNRVSKVVETAIFRVIYPIFCQVADNPPQLGRIYKCMTLAIMAIEVPAYMFLMFHAGFLVGAVFGPKWVSMAPVLQALALTGVANPFATFGLEVMRATRQDRPLFWASISAAIVLMTAGFLLTSRYGVMGMVAANYLQVSVFFTVPVLWRTIRSDFIALSRQLAIVYLLSFIVSGAAFILTSGTARPIAGAMAVIVLWLFFYKAYGLSVGKETLQSL
jgi:PST family polysaccharide transporter